MDIKEFKKRMASHPVLSEQERKAIIEQSLENDSERMKCIIAIEELAELQQEVSKQLRHCGDNFHFVEKIADVYICLRYLIDIFCFSNGAIQTAINVKLLREQERFQEKEGLFKQNDY